ncbi:hypothetical protein D9613_010079 [Agrocybe pediades]|uniref:Uncharacterized protein n=1 Tax=Agrocybe pediades TaxID=84607 RepID=A0A8H4QY49_9AGAR|nr:hypothetical protein D9613_010079 [Agrocybe pediades]
MQSKDTCEDHKVPSEREKGDSGGLWAEVERGGGIEHDYCQRYRRNVDDDEVREGVVVEGKPQFLLKLETSHHARQPIGLRRLVLANCPASTDLITEGVVRHIKEGLPPGTYEIFEKHEREGTTDSKEYQDAEKMFHQKHTGCTLDPWPEELLTSFSEASNDKSAHRAMNCQSYLRNGGNNKDWSVVPILHQILSPTLLLHSPTDLVHEIAMQPFFERIPKVKWVEFYNSSHLAQFEEPERYFKVVSDFLLG